MKHNVFLLLGSNLGDSLKSLATARNKIGHLIGPIIRKSSVYKTAPWGDTNQPEFLNQVILVETALKPTAVLEQIHRIEEQMGRVRINKWEARLIDIDILFFDQEIIKAKNLTIPHPRISIRRFVLEPLNEIASDFVHPELQEKITDLVTRCKDTSLVSRTTL